MEAISSDFCVVAAVNNEEILMHNLASSPMFSEGVALITMRGFKSAAKAYNKGISQTSAKFIVFAHQDVYLPRGWLRHIRSAITEIESSDPNWAVIGVYGVRANGMHVGHCWSSGLHRELGYPFKSAVEVCSVDELLIIMRRDSNIHFDEKLPGFHLYGTDIVQVAHVAGKKSYTVHAPVVHNSRPVQTLAGPYTKAYHYMQAKWADDLPINTVILPLTRFGFPLYKYRLKSFIKNIAHQKNKTLQTPMPGSEIARFLKYE